MLLPKVFSLGLLLLQLTASSEKIQAQETVQIVTGSRIQDYESTIVKLRMEELSQFPYLIWNGEPFEQEYAATYSRSASGALGLAYKDEQIIGLVTGISLTEYDAGLGQYGCLLIADQLPEFVDPKTIYHLGEIVSREKNLGQPIVDLFAALESQAKSWGFSTISFITIIRESNDPQMPPGYRDEESRLLEKLGYEKTGRIITYYWPTVQADGSTPNLENRCDIWLKKLSK